MKTRVLIVLALAGFALSACTYGSGAPAPDAEIESYEEAKSRLIGKSKAEVVELCGEPLEPASYTKCGTWDKDASEDEIEQFKQTSSSFYLDYPEFKLTFNTYDKVIEVKRSE